MYGHAKVAGNRVAKRIETYLMVQDYRSGAMLKEIGRQYGITLQAVQQRLASVGINHKDRAPIYQLIDKEQLKSLYAENLPIKKIAAHFGTHTGNIEEALKFHQIPKREGIGIWGHRVNILKQMEIGDKYEESFSAKCPYVRVYTSAKRIGIKVSTRQVSDGRLEITRIG